MHDLLPPRALRPETQFLVIEANAASLLGVARRALRPRETWTLSSPREKLGNLAATLATRPAALQKAAFLLAPTVARSDQELWQRTRVARLLLEQVLRSGSGELRFVTSASAGREARQELLALVEVFLSESGASPLLISALFLDAPRVHGSILETDFCLPEAPGQSSQELRRPALHGA